MWTLMQCLSGPCHVCFGRAKVQTENIIKAAAKVVATAANARALPVHVLDLQAFGYMGILQRDLWWFVWPFLEGMVRHLHAPGVKACSWGCEGCLAAQLFAMRPVQSVAMLCDRSRARVMHNALFWGQEQLEGCKEECQASRLDANTQAESFNAIQQFEVFHKMCWNWSYWFLEFERPKWLRQRWHGSSQVSTLVLGSCSPAWQRCVAFCCIDIELWPLCWRKRRGAASPVGSLDVDRNTSGLWVFLSMTTMNSTSRARIGRKRTSVSLIGLASSQNDETGGRTQFDEVWCKRVHSDDSGRICGTTFASAEAIASLNATRERACEERGKALQQISVTTSTNCFPHARSNGLGTDWISILPICEGLRDRRHLDDLDLDQSSSK